MRPGLMVAAAVVSVVAAGCSSTVAGTGGGTPTASAASGTTAATPEPPAASTSAADAAFVQAMIPHQEQAVGLSDLLLAKPGLNTELSDLATQLKSTAQPEIDRLRAWLGAHGVAEDASGTPDSAPLDAVRAADTLAAADLYLSAMIDHHEAAIALAEPAAASADAEVAALARAVVDRSTEEIAFMKELQVGF